MIAWNHRVCNACWIRREPERIPVRVMTDEAPEPCCFCQRPTNSGIYLRGDPEDVGSGLECRGRGPAHDDVDNPHTPATIALGQIPAILEEVRALRLALTGEHAAIEHEREECAKVAEREAAIHARAAELNTETMDLEDASRHRLAAIAIRGIATAIRARGRA